MYTICTPSEHISTSTFNMGILNKNNSDLNSSSHNLMNDSYLCLFIVSQVFTSIFLDVNGDLSNVAEQGIDIKVGKKYF